MEPEISTLDQLCKSIKTFSALDMAAENRNKLYRYNDALMQSLYSILDDREHDEAGKMQYLTTTLEQYAEAMMELFPKIISADVQKTGDDAPAPTISKSDPNRFDAIVEVEKFNPYHDSKGRFASADSHTSFTVRTKDPSKQHMADMAIAREKERNGAPGGTTTPKDKKPEKKPNNNPLGDPDSINGAERGEPMTREQANSNHVNPNYFKSYGYQVNCQSCVVAYEARLRGYDVQTLPNSKNITAEMLSRDTRLAWIDPTTGKAPNYITNEKVTTAKKCKAWMEETIQPGERYTFSHGWKGRSRTGHIISADKDESGNLRLYDPQNGKTMQGADIDSYLSRAKFMTTVYGTKIPRARLTRVDNMRIDLVVADGIMEAKS